MDRNVDFFKELQTGGGPPEAGAMSIDLGHFKLRRSASEKHGACKWILFGSVKTLKHRSGKRQMRTVGARYSLVDNGSER